MEFFPNRGIIYNFSVKFRAHWSTWAKPAKSYHTRIIFLVIFFEKITVYLTWCSKVEEETTKKDDKKENPLQGIDKTLIVLKTLPIHLNWRQIFHLQKWDAPKCGFRLTTLGTLYCRVKDVGELSEESI